MTLRRFDSGLGRWAACLNLFSLVIGCGDHAGGFARDGEVGGESEPSRPGGAGGLAGRSGPSAGGMPQLGGGPGSSDADRSGPELDGGTTGGRSLDARQADAGIPYDGKPDVGFADGGPEPLETFVPVPATGVYGTRTFLVPARANWVNSGLYLKKGQTVSVSATGVWSAPAPTGPSGSNSFTTRVCKRGSLVARLGLGYEDPQLLCVGDGGTFAAPRDGIVYFGALLGTDLGDVYDARRTASGALTVTVTSLGSTVPTVPSASISTYPFASLASGWVELLGMHVLVTVPASVATADRATAPASLRLLDAIYEQHAALRGAVPFAGAHIRFYPDPEVVVRGWYMLAGNPVRMAPVILTDRPGAAHILRSSDPAYDVWGFAHELGHDFAQVNGLYWYQVDSLEAWPNIFTVKTLRALRRKDFVKCGNDVACPTAVFCAGKAAQLASGSYATFIADPFLELCFLLELDDLYGGQFYGKFFSRLNAADPSSVPRSPDANVWGWVRDQFNAVSGANTTPRFQSWHIPLP